MLLVIIISGTAFGKDQSDMRGISIHLSRGEPYGEFPPAELLLVDPQGRKTGYNPISKIFYNEIPRSFYETTGFGGELTTEELDIRQPGAGDYQLFVIGKNKGGYTLEIAAWDSELNPSKEEFIDIPIKPNEIHAVRFRLSKTVGAELSATLDKKSRLPKDAPTFLGYRSPSSRYTKLPVGTRSYKISIIYGDKIMPLTFRVKHDGVDITPVFHAVPGTSEEVTINLRPENNTLKFSVDAPLAGSIVGHTDTIEIFVPCCPNNQSGK